MAEAIAKNLMPDLDFMSMGVAAANGFPASEYACIAMRDFGLDLSSHKSKMIDSELLATAKLVLTMTRSHLFAVKSFCNGANAYTLAGYAGYEKDIPDPFGGDLETYQECAKEIESFLLKFSNRSSAPPY